MDITPRKISYRSFPKEGLFKKLYREDMYKIEEFKEDFKYYENTSIEEIIIDEYHLIPFVFFLEFMGCFITKSCINLASTQRA
mgnify:CR=1 FL=1